MVPIWRGMTGPRVRSIQILLGVTADGIFGPQTEAVVEAFQGRSKLIADGVVGPVTFDELCRQRDSAVGQEAFDRQRVRRVKIRGPRALTLVKSGASLPSLQLRADVADRFKSLMEELVSQGGTMTTAGGTRALRADLNANRSAMSLHYGGAAFDLGLPSGAHRPDTDPFIVTRDVQEPRKWRVFARVECPHGEVRKLRAIVASGQSVDLEARVIDFTALAQRHGFERISSRRNAWLNPAANPGGMEWWHFQCEAGLVRGETSFGEFLLRTYSWAELESAPPFRFRHATFGEDWA